MTIITIEANKIEFEDKILRTAFSKLDSKVTSINERTKGHTFQIHEIEKRIKELEKNSNQNKLPDITGRERLSG